MEYGRFANGGTQYVITTPRTPDKWFNYLFNDQYYMEITQTGQGDSTCLPHAVRKITRGYRFFYVYDRETKDCWNPGYRPLKVMPDTYECIHALGWTQIKSSYKGVEACMRAFVPREGLREIWTVNIKNSTDQTKELSLFSVFSFENTGMMGGKCTYDSQNGILSNFEFPYHVYYQDKEKLDDRNSRVYLFADTAPKSYDCAERWFFGSDDITELPSAIVNGTCSNHISEAENPIGAFEHGLTLAPGEEKTINLIVGCANNLKEIAAIKAKYDSARIKAELEDVNQYWLDTCQVFTVKTPDENLNYFMNYWLKKQAALMTRTNRLSYYCPVRNQLQDAMGYSLLDTEGAAEYMFKVLAKQESNGYIQQWYMTDGSAPVKLCLLKHRDGPIWLVTCIGTLIHQSGDLSMLERLVEYKDTGEKATVYQHLLQAVYYLAGETGAHGLVLMGDGDWTDPINGAGRLGRGESTWSTLGLIYAAQQLLILCRKKGDTEHIRKLEEIAAKLDEAVNAHCWDGDWYIAGFDDDGVPFGTVRDQEGKLFLNAQTWALMAGVARGERYEKCVKAIESLNTACGPLLLAPEFSDWNPRWGRISIKLAGTTENGSIYCHASMFKAFADCVARDGEKAYETVWKTLPTNPENPPEKSWQVPLFLPNYYFGLTNSPNFGHSSQHNSTGTVAWMMWVVLEHMLGIRATVDGLEIDPCIPGDWKGYEVERRFKDAIYRIKVGNPDGKGEGVRKILVDGAELQGRLLPYEKDKSYTVVVEM